VAVVTAAVALLCEAAGTGIRALAHSGDDTSGARLPGVPLPGESYGARR
jgi:hypothetical protein